MSSRVRGMALSLATLMLLTSLSLVVQGFLNAPEALASCPERTWCGPPSGWYQILVCCCAYRRWMQARTITCYWQEWDCTINTWDQREYRCVFDEGPCQCP